MEIQKVLRHLYSRPITQNALMLMQSWTVRNHFTYNDPNFKFHNPTYYMKSKHYNPKFKLDRKLKFIKVQLPRPSKDGSESTPEEMRLKLKRLGMQPVRMWRERPILIMSTSGIFEPYVPPEGDGKMSSVTMEGAKQRMERLKKKTTSMRAIRKVQDFDNEFEKEDFGEQALDIYVKVHQCLNKLDDDNLDYLHSLVTENSYPQVIDQGTCKTVRWQYLGSLEEPAVVHARTTSLITDDNFFAQITVRLHTKQTLAIYDRFGRLIYGSEVVARDVLEYIVFEKNISNSYGEWRLHDKIIPDWMPSRPPTLRTYRVQTEVEPPVDVTPVEKQESATV